ncbi:hypothetical protein [Trebonia kvetii]|uniref:hypothetical protein n=1 Tax=Trebonia kvetii TaxID=2480626 RepID=UPI001652235E|nr:hypothetical protein [Trebonia kvetii]
MGDQGKFGVQPGKAVELARLAGSLGLNPYGLAFHVGSGRQLAFPVTIPGADSRPLVACMLTGPSCDSQDTIMDEVWLPVPRAGDLVLIGNAGAYTKCYSGRSAFNGYPAPVLKLVKRAPSAPPATRMPAASALAA